MATYTENYNLVLPETEDVFDVEDYNENFNSLDTALTTIEEKIDTLATTPSSIIKSIQHVTYSNTKNVANGAVSINPVDVTKAVVIMEFLYLNDGYPFSYTLEGTEISITHNDFTSTGALRLGFWIIEFN